MAPDQLPFDDAPAQARLTDPATSHEAAASVTNAERLRWVVLCRLCQNALERLDRNPAAPVPRSEMFDAADFLHAYGPEVGTPDFDLVEQLAAWREARGGSTYSPSGVRTRRHELAAARMVQQVPGFYVRTPTGRRALLWAPTAVGWRYWQADRRAAVDERVRAALAARTPTAGEGTP
jgi:hypothetical protein